MYIFITNNIQNNHVQNQLISHNEKLYFSILFDTTCIYRHIFKNKNTPLYQRSNARVFSVLMFSPWQCWCSCSWCIDVYYDAARRYMTETLPIRSKTIYNQSITMMMMIIYLKHKFYFWTELTTSNSKVLAWTDL